MHRKEQVAHYKKKISSFLFLRGNKVIQVRHEGNNFFLFYFFIKNKTKKASNTSFYLFTFYLLYNLKKQTNLATCTALS